MAKHSLKEWYLATRPWSFPASAMPVASTIAYLFWVSKTLPEAPQINLLYGLLALVGIIVFHAAGNVLSDHNDFRKGVDTPENAMMLPLVNGCPHDICRFGLNERLDFIHTHRLLKYRAILPI